MKRSFNLLGTKKNETWKKRGSVFFQLTPSIGSKRPVFWTRPAARSDRGQKAVLVAHGLGNRSETYIFMWPWVPLASSLKTVAHSSDSGWSAVGSVNWTNSEFVETTYWSMNSQWYVLPAAHVDTGNTAAAAFEVVVGTIVRTRQSWDRSRGLLRPVLTHQRAFVVFFPVRIGLFQSIRYHHNSSPIQQGDVERMVTLKIVRKYKTLPNQQGLLRVAVQSTPRRPSRDMKTFRDRLSIMYVSLFLPLLAIFRMHVRSLIRLKVVLWNRCVYVSFEFLTVDSW